MKVDFFRFDAPDGIDLSALMIQASKLPDDESRVQEIGGVPFRLHALTKHSNRYWEGEMLRIRMNDVPIIASLDGKVDDVELDDDEGIGEQTAFAYDNITQVVTIQRNRFGVPVGKLAKWFEQFGSLEKPLIPDIILGGDISARLDRIHEVRSYHVRFAGVTNPELRTSHGPSTAEATRLLSGKAPVIDIAVSMGRERGTLPIKATLDAVKKFYKWAMNQNGTEEVSVLRLDGTYDDDEPADINLLDFRMSEQVEVQIGKNRRMEFVDRIAGIRQAWSVHKGELEKMFKPGK